MRIALALTALIALAGCGGGSGGGNTTAAAPVTAVAPPAGKQWSEVVEKTDEGYRMGNPNAPVKLVEYGARLCPATRFSWASAVSAQQTCPMRWTRSSGGAGFSRTTFDPISPVRSSDARSLRW